MTVADISVGSLLSSAEVARMPIADDGVRRWLKALAALPACQRRPMRYDARPSNPRQHPQPGRQMDRTH